MDKEDKEESPWRRALSSEKEEHRRSQTTYVATVDTGTEVST